MSLSGIGSNNVTDVYAAASAVESEKKPESSKPEASNTDTGVKKEEAAAVYDKSKLSEDDRKSIVAQLKADQEKRQSQLTDLVHNMLNTQTNTFGQANNIWQFLSKGNYTVDAATQKKAQEAISEDGYWGVKQTSDRIVSFATALAGDDQKQLEKMRDAFLKGYEKAEKTWGGKLPEISKKTYDAVLEKFDSLLKPKETDKDLSVDKNNNAAADKNNTVTTTEDGTVVAK
ncbi:MAG: hypothetical protein K2P44_01775 [Lachnospiraceae bacterium]|nr:hypothetical protein [Lachnospiraceae bacterium]